MPGVCHRCKRNVYAADEKVTCGKVWHSFCVSCRRCRKLLDECSANAYKDEIYCRKCYRALTSGSTGDDEERRCGGRRGGCSRHCPTPARTRARVTPSLSPSAVTSWYSRSHSTQFCKGCPRCSAEGPRRVCDGGGRHCPDRGRQRQRSRTRGTSSRILCECDSGCGSQTDVSPSSEEKVCTAPKTQKKPSAIARNCCSCCAPERPRRKGCCLRCLRSEKAGVSDGERDCSPRSRSRRSCDRSTCFWLRPRQRPRRQNPSPRSTTHPPRRAPRRKTPSHTASPIRVLGVKLLPSPTDVAADKRRHCCRCWRGHSATSSDRASRAATSCDRASRTASSSDRASKAATSSDRACRAATSSERASRAAISSGRSKKASSSSDRTSRASTASCCACPKPRRRGIGFPIGKPCRRCGRQVYHAELLLAAGTVFHTSCFSCSQCRRPLESTTVCEAQNDIFCKQCYVKRFGPSGYGYGMGAGALRTP